MTRISALTRAALLASVVFTAACGLDQPVTGSPGITAPAFDEAGIVEGPVDSITLWPIYEIHQGPIDWATESGPATVDVQDGGAGIRFNFPAAARFRPITWDEWFRNFRQHELMFVYENDQPGRPPNATYRLVPRQKLRGRNQT